MKSKIFLISLLISLPFWLGMNVLADNLEDFWYLQEIVRSPGLLTAAADQKILAIELKNIREQKLREELFDNLQLQAEAAVSIEILNDGSEKVLFEKNSEQAWPIASLTKLMTALVVLDLDETYNSSQTVKITKEAVNQEGVSRFGELRIGDTMSIMDLIHKMLIESDNDAAFALTEPIGEKAFVSLMNIYSKEIGLKDTFFSNSTGLEKNTSTVRDLVRLTEYILENHPEIFEITTYKVDQNTNELLGEIPSIVGGKTGWTPEAKGCLLLVLENPRGNYFINIVLGSEDRFGDMRKIINAIR